MKNASKIYTAAAVLFLCLQIFAADRAVHAASLPNTDLETVSVFPDLAEGEKYLSPPKKGAWEEIALDFVSRNRSMLGLSEEDLEDFEVSARYVDSHTGVAHLYLKQRFQGIEIRGNILNVNVSADGAVTNLSHRFTPSPRESADETVPLLDPVEALRLAAAHLGMTSDGDMEIVETSGDVSRETLIAAESISLRPVRARLIFEPVSSSELRLAWHFAIFERLSPRYWSIGIDAATGEALFCLDLARRAEYEVFPLPCENPDDCERQIVENPSDAIASPYGWHDVDGAEGAEYTITRGNNVHAFTDKDMDESPDVDGEADGGAGLEFSGDAVPLDLDLSPLLQPEAPTANLFYLNNIAHDLLYCYGFDEASGNFQENNYGNGGEQNDPVLAKAQYGGQAGQFNNGYFITPADGENPEMKVLLWNETSPWRDGSFSAPLVFHEYAHGLTNRLTGGPSEVECLANIEQMGEGWSDFFAMVFTAKATDVETTGRGFLTWVRGNGPDDYGVRLAPYTTDMTVNDYTYGDLPGMFTEHRIGFVWCSMLWEMYWELVNQYGFNPDFYGDYDSGGNNLAIQLVVDALKLQPCSPGFVDARDAILLADQNLTGGQNQCAIWRAFAKRGLGYGAEQGSSNSVFDGVESFEVPEACRALTASPEENTICSGSAAQFDLVVNRDLVGADATFSAQGAPPEASVVFTPNPLLYPDENAAMSVESLSPMPAGSYEIVVTVDDGQTVENTTVVLNVAASAPPKTALSSPGGGAAWIDVQPEFSWGQSAEATDYLLEIDDDPSLSSVEYSASCDGTTHVPSDPLPENTVFYWRVSPGNICGQGEASDIFSFKTQGPEPSAPVIPIPDNDPEGISDAIVVPENGSISDLEVFVHIDHEWMGNVSVVLEHEETSTSAVLADRPGYPASPHGCSSQDMEAWLDDDAEYSVEFECEYTPPAIGGSLIPQEPLAVFSGESAAGRWILRVYDNAKSDQGTLLEWGLDFHGQGKLPIRLGGDRTIYFDSIRKAYENISQDDTIEAMAVSLDEDGLDFDRPLMFTLEGGLDADFEAGGGLTEIRGPVVLFDGTAVFSNVAIK